MQAAGVKGERAKPGGIECELVADDHIQIIVVPVRAGGWESGLLNGKIFGGVVVLRSAQEPLRTSGLSPIDSRAAEIIAKRNRDVIGNGDGIHAGNQALSGQRGEGVELRETRRAISDAGIFMVVFERGEEPELALHNRAAQRGDVILRGERLLGQRRGILDGITRIESSSAFGKGSVAMPLVGAALGGDDDGAADSAAGVRILLRSFDGKFLDGIRGKVLQETADVVIRIVAAVDVENIVESRTAAEGNCRDARFGGIGRLDGFSAGNEKSDVGKSAMSQGDVFEVLSRHGAAVNGAGDIDWLSGDGRSLGLNRDALLNGSGFQGDADVLNGADDSGDVGGDVHKPGRGNGQAVGPRGKIGEAKFTLRVGDGLALEGSLQRASNDSRGGNTRAGGVHDFADDAAAKILRARQRRQKNHGKKENNGGAGQFRARMPADEYE